MAETVRFDFVWGYTDEQYQEMARTMIEGRPVLCYFKDYPPAQGERSFAYNRRVVPLIMAGHFGSKQLQPSLWSRLRAWLKGE